MSPKEYIMIYRMRAYLSIKSKDKIVIKKIIACIDDVEKYTEGLEEKIFKSKEIHKNHFLKYNLEGDFLYV